MIDLAERLEAHTLPFVACLSNLSEDEASREPFTFQTFTDVAPGQAKPSPDPLAKVIQGSLEDKADELEALNQRGAGIFVSVNQTDLKGRSKKNISQLRGHHADLDRNKAEGTFDALAALAAMPLEPTMVVKTPNGLHPYWLALEPMPCGGEARWLEHEWELDAIQAKLSAHGADSGATTVERVLRLPGYYHCKGEPALVELLHADGPGHAREDIRKAFDVAEYVPKVPQAAPEARERVKTHLSRPEVFALAGEALDRMPEAIQGQDGSGALFGAALRIIAGFDLDEYEALELLEARYNPRCVPPWSEAELEHKVAGASTAAKDRGHLLPTIPGFTAVAEDWPEPQPLTSRLEALPYPLEALPQTIKAAVEEVQGFVQAPVALVAASAMGAVSLAAQALVDIQRAEKLSGPVGLFLLSIADSGERKSTCDDFFTKSIRTYETSQAMLARPLVTLYEADLAAWESSKSGIKGAIQAAAKDPKSATKKGLDPVKLKEDLRSHEQAKPKPPRVPRLVYGDITTEKLLWSLATEWPSGGIVSSEGGAVLGSHSMGKDTVTRNLSTYDTLWGGSPIPMDRRTSESYTVAGARLTIALQVQPEVLKQFLSDTGSIVRGIGFLARCLISQPMSTQGYRAFQEAPDHWPAASAFNDRIGAILSQPVRIGEDGSLKAAMLTFTPEAKAAWVAFHDRIELELRDGGSLRDVRDVASKIADNAARISALFHVFERVPGALVGLESFDAAAQVAEWHLHEARRFYGDLAMPEGLANASKLEDWLVGYCLQNKVDKVPSRDALRLGPHALRDKIRFAAALAELAALDRAKATKEGSRKFICLNPVLLGQG